MTLTMCSSSQTTNSSNGRTVPQEQKDWKQAHLPMKSLNSETAETRPAVPAETGTLFCETGEMELAAELFEVTSEAELEEFLGKLINRASRAAGSVIPSSAKQAIGGVLKGAARQVLPAIISAARGNFTRHPAAGAGNLAAIAAGRLFGLELEGLSGEDQEFEVARSFASFAGNTVKNLTRSPDSRNPQSAARLAQLLRPRSMLRGLSEVGAEPRAAAQDLCLPPATAVGGCSRDTRSSSTACDLSCPLLPMDS